MIGHLGDQEYAPFPGLILTDTFQSWEDDDRLDYEVFRENNERLERLKSLPITVVLGNPPYSVGQDSANDENANRSYPTLDAAIRDSYAVRAGGTEARSLYDSYIRAIKWASLRIQDRGVIAYVTNGGWLDSNTADGMRQALANEFSAIHIYNLRGKALGAGEERRKEGGSVFGGGSRATVAVTVLVKNPTKPRPATIHYTDIGDYLSGPQKLAKIADAGSLAGLDTAAITPNAHGDWLNQRSDAFAELLPLGAKDARVTRIFDSYTLGIGSNRDAWVYSCGTDRLLSDMARSVASYNEALAGNVTRDEKAIKWTATLEALLRRRVSIALNAAAVRPALYRPFQKQQLYADPHWIHRPGEVFDAFPTAETTNMGFLITGVSSHAPFSVMACDLPPDKHLLDTGQFFPRWRYEAAKEDGTLRFDDGDSGEVYRRIDNVTDQALTIFRTHYGDKVTKDDIFYYTYGLLHSPQYRETFAADLKKMLPRVPFAATGEEIIKAGRELFELHVGYESVEPYPVSGLDVTPTGDPYEYFRVEKMNYIKVRQDGKLVPDRTAIQYNSRIRITGIPTEAQQYLLGPRSAVDWVMDRYQLRTDKDSGNRNDPNEWSRQVGDPRYILDLVARVVTVSVRSVEIINQLPPLALDGTGTS